METLVLYYREEPLSEFTLADRPLEVGSAAYCDIVVHDATLAARAMVVEAAGGTVVAYDLTQARHARRPSQLPLGAPLRIGEHHALVRVARPPQRKDAASGGDGPTERLEARSDAPGAGELRLVIGRGPEARRRRLGPRPLHVGSGPDNDLVLVDRSVSAAHCRFERTSEGVLVRDLGSRNGTWVQGVGVKTALLSPGALVRVGRTELRLERLEAAPAGAPSSGLVYKSTPMGELIDEARRLAPFGFPVLITGESGAGKEGIARMLHDKSPRASGPFVAVNAGSLSPQLVESELFGHERGAFTGAVASHRGAFEQASRGTLFLDEIGELPLSLQARLLRVLDSWEVRRVGGEGSVKVDVRLVTATHRDLPALVRADRFRADLYYRIRQECLHVPPLRERPADVPALAAHFLADLEPSLGARTLAESALARLLAHPFPGNVRELRNIVRAAAIRASSPLLEAADIEGALTRLGLDTRAEVSDVGLAAIVERHAGNTSAAALALGIPRSTLRDRLRRAAKEP